MKLLFAECCSELVVPEGRANQVPRYCSCGCAAVWWVDRIKGILGVFAEGGRQAVSVIGLHNGLLSTPYWNHGSGDEYGCLQADVLKNILSHTPESYLFKQVESLVIKVRPGFTGDIFLFPDRKDIPSNEVPR